MIKNFLLILLASLLVFSCGSDDEEICKEKSTKCNGNILQTCTNNAWVEINCENDSKICQVKDEVSSCIEKVCDEGKTNCNGNILQTCKNNAWVEINCENDDKICKTQNEKSSCEKDVPENMVLVEGGTFMMGSKKEDTSLMTEDEAPQHEVKLSSFYINKYEVTNAEFCEFLNVKKTVKGQYDGKEVIWVDIEEENAQIKKVDDKYVPKEGKEKYPAIKVTWYGATAYSQWKGGRLPTEAEWEYAAMGGNKNKACDNGCEYAGSNNADEVCWFNENADNPNNDMFDGKGTHEVGKKKPNELGLYDMSGNVWEWTNDWYGDYNSQKEENPLGSKEGMFRVLRGGAWFSGVDFCRVKIRERSGSDTAFVNYGFRFVILP